MDKNIVAGILILVALLVAAILAILFGSSGKKSKSAKPIEQVKKKAAKKKPAVPQLLKGEPSIVPEGIPRTMGSIKIISEEDPSMVAKIIRGWLQEDKKYLATGQPDPRFLAETFESKIKNR